MRLRSVRLNSVRFSHAWQSPATWPGYWLAGVFAISAGYAGVFAFTSSEPLHRLWGQMAACGYGVALVAVLVLRGKRWGGAGRWGPDLALVASLLGALLVPLSVMAVRGQGQPEVDVVARSASMLIHQGTPYESAASLASTTDPNAYNPYLPVMALFGLPRAIFGGGALTDPRIWFGLAFIALFAWALRAGGAQDTWRWTILVVASPVIALELAVGGTDVPMVACLCLGFGLLATKPSSWRILLAGVALGIAAGMKATAWPGLVVAIVMLTARDGWRVATRFTVTAVLVTAVCVVPFLVHAKDLVVNTIEFPLGLAGIRSAAASPLPGHLIAGLGHAGHTAVVVLLALTAAAVAATLVIRPPRTVPRAVFLLAWAMSLMFLLAPSTRFGYFIYPGTLALWLLAVTAGRDPGGQPDPGQTANNPQK
jgi:hypothetical protein